MTLSRYLRLLLALLTLVTLGGCLDEDTPAECVPATGDLVAALDGYTGPYSVLVHIDTDGETLLGYAVDTGPTASVDEAMARDAAQGAAYHGEPIASHGALLGVRAGQWLFTYGAGDYTLLAVVSGATGKLTLGVSVAWTAWGSTTSPLSWSDAADLGARCGGEPSFGEVGEVELDPFYGGAIPAARRDAALAAVRRTALLEALWARGTVTGTLLVEIPRYATSVDPHEYRFAVLVSGVAD